MKFSNLPRHPIFYLAMLLLWKPNLDYKMKFMAVIGCGRGAQWFPCYGGAQRLLEAQEPGAFQGQWDTPSGEWVGSRYCWWGWMILRDGGETEQFSRKNPCTAYLEVTTLGEAARSSNRTRLSYMSYMSHPHDNHQERLCLPPALMGEGSQLSLERRSFRARSISSIKCNVFHIFKERFEINSRKI